MCLLGVVGHVADERPARAGGHRLGRLPGPVAEEIVDSSQKIIPVDAAGDRHDHSGRLHPAVDKLANIITGRCFEVGGDALGGHAPGGGQVEQPQGCEHAVGRVVLDAGDVLEHHLLGGLELLGGQLRPADHVGEDRQHHWQLPGHHRG